MAAGPIRTPQLLKLSGIGPATELQSWNITVFADLAGVGNNLQDHLLLSLTCEYYDDYFSYRFQLILCRSFTIIVVCDKWFTSKKF